MIRLFTGLPGHGKTLRVVHELIEARAKDDARPLYVRGINGLTVDHATLEGPDWQDCPDGALIVIDEAQQVFPIRRSGEVPAYIQALATHRHRGIDIWLITQHPSLIDSFARKLIDRHTHIFRISGSEVAQVYEWGEVQDDPRSMSAREVSEAHTWKYPKAVYGAYSSAVMHTAKFRIPKKLVYLLACVVVGGVCIVGVVGWGKSRMEGTISASDVNASPVGAALAARPPAPVPKTAEEWLAQYAPRVAYRPESAPAYDRLMQAAPPPKLYCVDVEFKGCTCYTDQMTIWQGVQQDQCARIAKGGLYRVAVPSRNS